MVGVMYVKRTGGAFLLFLVSNLTEKKTYLFSQTLGTSGNG